jgi:hypothetical protein
MRVHVQVKHDVLVDAKCRRRVARKFKNKTLLLEDAPEDAAVVTHAVGEASAIGVHAERAILFVEIKGTLEFDTLTGAVGMLCHHQREGVEIINVDGFRSADADEHH